MKMKNRLNPRVTTALVILLGMVMLLIYTKVIWQSGFDAGADTNGCVFASVVKYGDLSHGTDEADPACQRIKAYESSPLWVLRRRNGG